MNASLEAPVPAESRTNRALKWFCGLLILMVTSQIILQFASIPLYYERVTTAAVPTLVEAGEVQVSNL